MAPRSISGSVISRNAPRDRIGKLGTALDVAQSGPVRSVSTDERHVLAWIPRANPSLVLHGTLDGRILDLGWRFLVSAASDGTGNVRRTPNRSRLGSEHVGHRAALSAGMVARIGGLEAFPCVGAGGRDGLPRQSRDSLRLVLHSGYRSVRNGRFHGGISRLCPSDLWSSVRRMLFCSWTEVLSAETSKRLVIRDKWHEHDAWRLRCSLLVLLNFND